MSIEAILIERSGGRCELCGSTEGLGVVAVAPSDGSAEQSVYLCTRCQGQLSDMNNLDVNHWRCLSDAMWSQVPAVQVLAWRLYDALGDFEQRDMIYLEDDVRAWAEAGAAKGSESEEDVVQRDANGTPLAEGDSVILIKDLDVKGGGFTAKRGTIVKNIRLSDDPKYIEGKINNQVIMIVAAFTKKV
ncbi:MAG: PhnA domain-containing protein [Campylobacterales bacterium]